MLTCAWQQRALIVLEAKTATCSKVVLVAQEEAAATVPLFGVSMGSTAALDIHGGSAEGSHEGAGDGL